MNNKNSAWANSRMGDVVDILIGGTPSRNKIDYWDTEKSGDNVWVSIRDLSQLQSHYIEDSKEYLSDLGVRKSNVKLIPPNTVLMSFKLSIGKTAITKKSLYTNEAIAGFVIKNSDILDHEYLFHVLPLLRYETDVAIKGNTLNKEKLKNTVLEFPNLSVQKKIASILTSLDNDIEKTDQIIQKTEELKKGLMNNLMTRGIGHSNFKNTSIGKLPTTWDVVRFSDVAKVERGKFSHRPRNAPEFYGGSIPFIQTGDVVNSRGRIRSYTQTLNEKGLSVSKLFNKGTIVLTIAANIGDTGILEFDACFPDSLVGITPSDRLDTVFLEYYLRSQKAYLNSISTQSAQKNINLAKLNPMLIVVPPIDEQRKIGVILSLLDDKLHLEIAEKKNLSCLKSGLMNDIFGRKVEIN